MADLKVLLLDVDDTLYSTSEFAATARRNAMQALVDEGVGLTVDQLIDELREVVTEFGSNYSLHYDQLIRRLPDTLLPPGNRALLIAAAVGAYHDTKFRSLQIFSDVPTVLAAIRENTTLRVGVITEGLTAKQAEKLVRLDVLPWIDRDAVFISEQVGISKPNTKLYLRACECLGVEPAEVLYVGDHPVNDIAPAHAVGMVTVRHRWTGGKYAAIEGDVAPDHEIARFSELPDVLRGRGVAGL